MPIDPREAALASKRIGDAGRRAEAKAAKRHGGKLVPGSGSGNRGGDFDTSAAPVATDTMRELTGGFLVESKSTTGRSMSLKHSWLAQINRQARDRGKTPALQIQFTDHAGTCVDVGDWVAIPGWLFQEMTHGHD